MTWRPALPLPPVNTIRLPPDDIVKFRLVIDTELFTKDGLNNRESM